MHEVALMYCRDRNIIRASLRLSDKLGHALFMWHMTALLRGRMAVQERALMDALNEHLFGVP